MIRISELKLPLTALPVESRRAADAPHETDADRTPPPHPEDALRQMAASALGIADTDIATLQIFLRFQNGDLRTIEQHRNKLVRAHRHHRLIQAAFGVEQNRTSVETHFLGYCLKLVDLHCQAVARLSISRKEGKNHWLYLFTMSRGGSAASIP